MATRDKLVNKDASKVRVKGMTGSPQNRLRKDLYKNAVRRIVKAIEVDAFIEAVALCDSMITDRAEALSQAVLNDEPKNFPTTSIVEAMTFVGSSYKQKNQTRSPELVDLSERITDWAKNRNIVLHQFVIVSNDNINKTVEDREIHAKETAETGYKLFRDWDAWTRKEIKRIKETT
jgi:hypothetical protein